MKAYSDFSKIVVERANISEIKYAITPSIRTTSLLSIIICFSLAFGLKYCKYTSRTMEFDGTNKNESAVDIIIPTIVVIIMAPKKLGNSVCDAYIRTYLPDSASGIILELTQAEAMINNSARRTANTRIEVARVAPFASLLAENLWYMFASPSTRRNAGRQKFIISNVENTPKKLI